ATAGVPAGRSQYAPVQLTLPVPGAAGSTSAAAPVSGSSFTLTAAWQQDLANMSLDDFLGFERIAFIPYPSTGCSSCLNSYSAELLAYSDLAAPYRALRTARGDADTAIAKLTVDLGSTVGGALVISTTGATGIGAVGIGALVAGIDGCLGNL